MANAEKAPEKKVNPYLSIIVTLALTLGGIVYGQGTATAEFRQGIDQNKKDILLTNSFIHDVSQKIDQKAVEDARRQEKTEAKLDQLKDQISELKVIIQNKQDRK